MYSSENELLHPGSGKSSVSTILAYTCLVFIILVVAVFMWSSIKRVTVEKGGKTVSYYTFAPKVSTVLKELGVREDFGSNQNPSLLKDGEELSYYTLSRDLDQDINHGTSIKIIHNRIEKKAETRVVSVPAKREWDIFLAPGKQRVIDPGRNGLIRDTFVAYYRDGKLTDRKKVSSEVVVTPKPVRLALGSYEVISRQGPVRGGRAFKFEATAYTHTGYRTATGAHTRRGIVAVDPRVIPLGTKLYIEGYGHGVAADTGGAIKGRRIDVFLESEVAARKWGRRSVDVYILSK